MNIKTSDFGSFLMVTGMLLAVLYIPNGLLHRFLGSGVYGRDILLGFHLTAMTMYLLAIRQLRYFLRFAWPLLAVLALVVLPLYNSRGNLKDLLVTTKWGFMWLDWMGLGYLASLRVRVPSLAIFLAACAFLVVCADASIGAYEEHTNVFFFPAQAQDTQAGVTEGRNNQLEGNIRVQGLQRDVFTFANFMGVGFTTCLCIMALRRKPGVFITFGALATFFGYVGFNCGGRSVFFGMLLVLALFAMAFFVRPFFNRHAAKVLLAAIIGEGLMCLIGIGQTLLYTLNTLGLHGTVMNLASSFERDEVWKERLNMLLEYPISLFCGMPSAYYISRAGDPIMFVDNLPLWILYHFGVVGIAMLTFFFFRLSDPAIQRLQPTAYLVFILFMGLVWGEGLARDTLGLYSCLPMFGAAGYLAGKIAAEQRQRFLQKHRPSSSPAVLVA